MSDHHLIFDKDTLADESMALDFAAVSNYGIFLYFYEWAYFCLVAYGAAVEIGVGGDGDIFA